MIGDRDAAATRRRADPAGDAFEMKYADGQNASLGDRVKLWGSKFGTIVCSLDDDCYSDGFTREDWAPVGRGNIIKADDGMIFRDEEADEDMELLSRASREPAPNRL